MGDLYYSYMPHSAERWKELAVFFREFRTFVQELAPTKPVAFAPNNVRFHLYAEEWKTILPFKMCIRDRNIPLPSVHQPSSSSL